MPILLTAKDFLDKLKGQRRANGLPHDQRQIEGSANMQDLPSPELLRKLLRYEPDTGKLFWLERPRDMFPTHRAHKIWNGRFSGKEAFTAPHSAGYRQGSIFYRKAFAHRVIWAMINDCWPENDIDHMNGVRSDNRLCNLRHVTKSENRRNAAMRGDNVSGYNGVRKDKNSWAAFIGHNGKTMHLGCFAKKSDAVAAREAAEERLGYTDRHGTNEAQRNGSNIRGVLA